MNSNLEEQKSRSTQVRRTKVTTACGQCRAKKIKCDGKRPQCQTCFDKLGYHVPCTWEVRVGGRSVPKARYLEMEHRLAELERAASISSQLNNSTVLKDFPSAGGSQTSASYYTPSPSGIRSSQGMVMDTAEASSTHHIAATKPVPGPSSAFYGIVGEAIDAALGQAKQHGTYGTSSVGSLVTNIWNLLNMQQEASKQTHPFQSVLLEDQAYADNLEGTRDSRSDYDLPPRKAADHLLSLYWSLFHPIFPVLDAAEVETAYEDLWTGHRIGPQNRVLLCIVNTTFALASRVDHSMPIEDREAVSAKYFNRARSMYGFHRSIVTSFPSVQAFLLMGEYLHTIDPQQCWLYIGMAIRMAQSLGLHQSRLGSSLSSSPRAKQLVLRVWYLCVTWDRIISMTYGRPTMIDQRAATTHPLPATYLTDIPDQPSPEVSAFHGSSEPYAFFVKSTELYAVVARVLEDFANTDLKHSSTRLRQVPSSLHPMSGIELDCVLKHDGTLHEWRDNLPHFLRLQNVSENSAFHGRQAVILHQRFLQVRTVILRPLLSSTVMLHNERDEMVASFDHGTLLYNVMLQYSASCIATAQETIRTIHQYDTGEGSLTNTWWHNILYLYSAATALIAARVCAPLLSQVSESSVRTSWDLLMESLKRYGEHGAWVREVTRVLEILAVKSQNYGQTHEELAEGDSSVMKELSGSASILEGFQPSIDWSLLDPFDFACDDHPFGFDTYKGFFSDVGTTALPVFS